MNTKARKTTHSWPVICRQSKQYASDDDEDDDDNDDDEDVYNDDDDDQSEDYETVFALNNNFTQSKKSFYNNRTSTTPSIDNSTDIEYTFNNNDNLSNRKYLVADYNPKQSQSDTFHTTSSVVNAQSDFNTFSGGSRSKSISCSSRLLGGRNSIVPLLTQTQAQRRQTILMDAPVTSSSMQSQQNHDDSNTTCTTPPPVIFLFVTLLMTISATGMLCFAVMTDHWELVKWDRNLLDHLTNKTTPKTILHWHLDDRVARMPITRK